MDNHHLEQLIAAAMKKVGAKKENDICRYIPASDEGYVHHFSFQKIKGEDPKRAAELIASYITNVAKPQKIAPKPRAPRGSRGKRKEDISFSKQEVERLVQMARLAGDEEMVRKLSRNTKDQKTIKKELISSIRHNRYEPELWNLYADQFQLAQHA